MSVNSKVNILDNEAAMVVLRDAAARLTAVGVLARVEPTSAPGRPQALGALLIAGPDLDMVARLHVQNEIGCMSCQSESGAQFDVRVKESTIDAVFKASTYGVELSQAERAEMEALIGEPLPSNSVSVPEESHLLAKLKKQSLALQAFLDAVEGSACVEAKDVHGRDALPGILSAATTAREALGF